MVWVVFESGGFCFSMIFYNGSRTSQTNDSKKKKKKKKKKKNIQALTHLASASLALQTTISLQVFLDV